MFSYLKTISNRVIMPSGMLTNCSYDRKLAIVSSGVRCKLKVIGCKCILHQVFTTYVTECWIRNFGKQLYLAIRCRYIHTGSKVNLAYDPESNNLELQYFQNLKHSKLLHHQTSLVCVTSEKRMSTLFVCRLEILNAFSKYV